MTEPFSICGLNPLVDNPNVNLTYDDILQMSDDEFLEYITLMRETIRHIWDKRGIPPSRGWSEHDVEDDFRELAGFNTTKLWKVDELTGRRVIHNTHVLGNSVNAWNLSKMLKVRINYTEKDNGRSIYDFFAKDDLFAHYLPYARRHFLRDSFYFFAQTVKKGDALPHRPEIVPQTAEEYIKAFATHARVYGTHEIILEPKAKDKAEYSGYADHLRDAEFFSLSWGQVLTLSMPLSGGKPAEPTLPQIALRLCHKLKAGPEEYDYHVRVYERGQKLFPAMFKSFRVSMCQYAVNFPPMTAKALYEHFLPREQDEVIVWDPSMGWAGRILGAMSANIQNKDGSASRLHYLGSDPNPEFYANGTSMYASVANFYNAIREGDSLFDESHTFKAFPCGSEMMRAVPAFQKYKGKLDLVFTSPPYFNREAYVDDPEQSFKKFPAYDSWRDGFLEKTLATAYEWLKPGAYLLWNIADVKIGEKLLPLEQDSIAITEKLGFEHTETILMTLRGMPGANRGATTEEVSGPEDVFGNADTKTVTKNATAKNFCKVDGRLLKFEPVHVFRKV